MNQTVRTVALSSVQFHRPDYPPAEHDDFSNQGRALNCESPSRIWAELLKTGNDSEMIGCLNSLETGEAKYLYVSDIKPYLMLNKDEKNQPECLLKTLSTIPLPREIYFLGSTQSNLNDQDEPTPKEDLSCFSISFDTKANQVMDAKLRYPRSYVNFKFPLSRKLKNEKDLQLWLLTSVLSIFNQDRSSWSAKASLVPDATCKQCFQKDLLFNDKKKHKLDPLEWP